VGARVKRAKREQGRTAPESSSPVRRRDGRGWATEVAGPSESIRIHGIDLHVDTIYA
jgi:hypothetical protein